VTENDKGAFRVVANERGWLTELQVWTGTEWRNIEAGGELAGAVFPLPSPAVGGRFEIPQ